MFRTLLKFVYAKAEGRSPKWSAVRKAFLEGKTCAACGGTKDLEAHHCEVFHLHPEKELDPNNLIPLCEAPNKRCHYIWGHLNTSWSTWNVNVRDDAAAWLRKVEKAP